MWKSLYREGNICLLTTYFRHIPGLFKMFLFVVHISQRRLFIKQGQHALFHIMEHQFDTYDNYYSCTKPEPKSFASTISLEVYGKKRKKY